MTPQPIKFNANPIMVGSIGKRTQHEIKFEPQFFRATPEYISSYHPEAKITQEFLSQLPWKAKLVDTRVHMLMPGMYPCIPGWHLDDVPRTRVDGQPEHYNPHYDATHCCAVLGSNSLTEFLIGEVTLVDVPLYAGHVYSVWHHQIEELKKWKKVKSFCIAEGQVLQFGFGDFHQGLPATGKGYRIFLRATKDTELEPQNEIRPQSQVYLTQPFNGW